MEDKWHSQWLWEGPDWKDINSETTSAVGFIEGPALSPEAKKQLDTFIQDMAGGKLNLFQGPLNYQDKTPFLESGETATDQQIWYMEQLLEGMEGQSSAK